MEAGSGALGRWRDRCFALVLKNPSPDGHQPAPGISSGSPELRVGRKVIVEGPVSCALWPGQLAKVVEGHRLRSNHYLLVRCYDAEAAAQHDDDAPWAQGEVRVIRGTETSFYLPRTGLEVVPDDRGRYIRQAVSLQRLEYCILVGEDGKKAYVRGEAVVFPEPSQRFLSREGRRSFRAIELSETTGVYLKVIAPYDGVDEDSGEPRSYVEGEELFLTGKDRLYFPREEHAIINYGDDRDALHHAVAVPEGEGRYLLDRQTGSISLVRGPRMQLPDPRRHVIVRRALTDRECALMFPGNAEVLAFNRAVRSGQLRSLRSGQAANTTAAEVAPQEQEVSAPLSDSLTRGRYKQPRTLTLDTRLDGAVTLEVWPGFAVQVKDRQGARRVVTGPTTLLLAYTDTVEALTLSTGTPKSAERSLQTAYLQLSGNRVSDAVELTSRDLARSRLQVRCRVTLKETRPSAGSPSTTTCSCSATTRAPS